MGASWPQGSAQAGHVPIGKVSTLRLRLQVRVAEAEEVSEVDVGASRRDGDRACEVLRVSAGSLSVQDWCCPSSEVPRGPKRLLKLQRSHPHSWPEERVRRGGASLRGSL